MAAETGKPSLARRFALGLRKLGVDPTPAFQRARDLLLRPVRHELGDVRREQERGLQRLAAALRDELGLPRQELAQLHAQIAALRQEAATLQQQLMRHRPGLTEGDERRVHLLEQLLAGPGLATGSLPSPAPVVSIVMPTRDRAGCIAEAIASVQAQDYPYWELLIVDDGSRDETAEVVAHFLGDKRIRYDAIPGCGPSGARNHALLFARGEYIAYLDSDNLWFPGFLAAAVAALADDPGTDLVYGVLATDVHGGGRMQLLFEPFERARLERGNYIDLNVVVHRRALYEAHGGFDESLARLVDWELLLRYTAQATARALPVLATRYRVCDAQRISDTVPAGPSWLAIRRRNDPPARPARAPRVLYVIWHYPQLSETYVEGEIRCLRRWGVEVAVWREVGPASPYEAQVPIFEGDLAKAVRAFQPDVLHVHWMGYALGRGEELAALGLPVTLRMHGFDVREAGFRQLMANDWLHRVYAYPRQLELLVAPDERVRTVPAGFDTSYFHPSTQKDPRLVLRASACLPSKELELFFEVAKMLPSHRFVLCGVTCNKWEHYPAELRRMAAEMASPVELRFDVPREEMAELMARAGIYLHTIHPPEAAHGAPIGMPISIAEAMATGAYTLVRDLPELVDYVGDAGAVYSDAAHAAALIRATMQWSEAEWRRRRVRASDFTYVHYADEVVFRTILEDWQALAQRSGQVPATKQAAGAA
jgi:glycosyltransferase involved in cell wall biosynthesis